MLLCLTTECTKAKADQIIIYAVRGGGGNEELIFTEFFMVSSYMQNLDSYSMVAIWIIRKFLSENNRWHLTWKLSIKFTLSLIILENIWWQDKTSSISSRNSI